MKQYPSLIIQSNATLKSNKNPVKFDLAAAEAESLNSPDKGKETHLMEFTQPSPAKYVKTKMNNLTDEDINYLMYMQKSNFEQ